MISVPSGGLRMKHVLLSIALMLALAGCGGGDRAANRGDSTVDNATLTKFDLASSSFQPNGAIPAQHSCDGADQSPALSWGSPPPARRASLWWSMTPMLRAARSGTGARRTFPPKRVRSRRPGGGKQAVNGAGKSGYMGPCPPPGHGATIIISSFTPSTRTRSMSARAPRSGSRSKPRRKACLGERRLRRAVAHTSRR